MLAITIDGGTTNTRVMVWRHDRIISRASAEVGVRDTAITGNKQKLQAGVRNTILEAAALAGIEVSGAKLIVASGMITSEKGLLEVPHIPAPVDIRELAAKLIQKVIPEVSAQPIWFVPGVKNSIPKVDLLTYEAMDIMRGEEVEAFGLLEHQKLQGPAICVFPGSHSKFVTVGKKNQITACITTLAGELLDVVTGHTILASAVANSFVGELDEAMLFEGARCSAAAGLTRALFSARILELFSDSTSKQRANFLLGAVLGQDIVALKRSSAFRFDPATPVVITGKKVMKQAFAALISSDSFFRGEVIAIDDDIAGDLAGLGAMALARERGLMG